MGDPVKLTAELGNNIRDFADVDVAGILDGGQSTATGLLTGSAFVLSSAASIVGETSAGVPLGITSTVLGAMAKAVNGGCTAYSAQDTIAKLRKAQEKAYALPSSTPEKADLVKAIGYCVAKTGVKMHKGLANATIVGQPGVTLYRAGRAVVKKIAGTKGKHREYYAKLLMSLAGQSSPAGEIAKSVVAAVLMKNFDQIATKALEEGLKSG